MYCDKIGPHSQCNELMRVGRPTGKSFCFSTPMVLVEEESPEFLLKIREGCNDLYLVE